jgi:hypothetical protein
MNVEPGDVPDGMVRTLLRAAPYDPHRSSGEPRYAAWKPAIAQVLTEWEYLMGRDEPDEPCDPDEAAGVHQCKTRLIASQLADRELVTLFALSGVPGAGRPGKDTLLLMYCDGCGSYSTIRLHGTWTLADLDPGFPGESPAAGPPADVR